MSIIIIDIDIYWHFYSWIMDFLYMSSSREFEDKIMRVYIDKNRYNLIFIIIWILLFIIFINGKFIIYPILLSSSHLIISFHYLISSYHFDNISHHPISHHYHFITSHHYISSFHLHLTIQFYSIPTSSHHHLTPSRQPHLISSEIEDDKRRQTPIDNRKYLHIRNDVQV